MHVKRAYVLNFTGIIEFKHERNNENYSNRSSKMRPPCERLIDLLIYIVYGQTSKKVGQLYLVRMNV